MAPAVVVAADAAEIAAEIVMTETRLRVLAVMKRLLKPARTKINASDALSLVGSGHRANCCRFP